MKVTGSETFSMVKENVFGRMVRLTRAVGILVRKMDLAPKFGQQLMVNNKVPIQVSGKQAHALAKEFVNILMEADTRENS